MPDGRRETSRPNSLRGRPFEQYVGRHPGLLPDAHDPVDACALLPVIA
ncbi:MULTISPECIES: hypothetical protein [unclassified Streptomyces]|nr:MULTISPECIES: hypothetical protein [unclassified Streptomyces]MYZ40716.1 hypothetical protein [Streptomyces sp. SID4917]